MTAAPQYTSQTHFSIDKEDIFFMLNCYRDFFVVIVVCVYLFVFCSFAFSVSKNTIFSRFLLPLFNVSLRISGKLLVREEYQLLICTLVIPLNIVTTRKYFFKCQVQQLSLFCCRRHKAHCRKAFCDTWTF